jgi:hypothetical protein
MPNAYFVADRTSSAHERIWSDGTQLLGGTKILPYLPAADRNEIRLLDAVVPPDILINLRQEQLVKLLLCERSAQKAADDADYVEYVHFFATITTWLLAQISLDEVLAVTFAATFGLPAVSVALALALADFAFIKWLGNSAKETQLLRCQELVGKSIRIDGR